MTDEFSKRFGFVPIEKAIQYREMDKELRNSLWTVIHEFLFHSVPTSNWTVMKYYKKISLFARLFYINILKKPTDEIPTHTDHFYPEVKKFVMKCEVHELYELIEKLANWNLPEFESELFMNAINYFLNKENSAFRFSEGMLIAIVGEKEIEEIEMALSNSEKDLKGVNIHLRESLKLFSDRQSPNYRNSVKESISAVESLVSKIIGEKTSLGNGLKELEKKYPDLMHKAQKEGFLKLYGYSSDKEGIRHAISKEDTVTKEDAHYMLITCSAFINFILSKGKKMGIRIET